MKIQHSSTRGVLAIASLILLGVVPSPSFGGTGAGNEFRHHENYAFDFHVASPPDWVCQNCDATKIAPSRPKSESVERWTIVAPDSEKTMMSIDFITDFPAVSSPELLDELKRREASDITWSPFDRGSLVGFSSASETANEAVEYYLVDRRMGIRIQWRKDGAFPTRAMQLDLIKASIDRTGTPPKLISIRSEKTGPYKPGDVACLLVEVDDLKSGFSSNSLKKLEIEATLPHWNFKSITWEGKSNWFRVCYDVTTAFPTNGLRIKQLTIEDSEDTSRKIECRATRSDPGILSCPPEDRASTGSARTLTPALATVNNPSPDLEGPSVNDMTVDVNALTMRIDASDPSGIAIASLKIGDREHIIYPDQIGQDRSIPLSQVSTRGWNTVTSVTLFDGHGFPTQLRLPLTHQNTNSNDPVYYEIVPWVGSPRPSNVKVITFLRGESK